MQFVVLQATVGVGVTGDVHTVAGSTVVDIDLLQCPQRVGVIDGVAVALVVKCVAATQRVAHCLEHVGAALLVALHRHDVVVG